MQLTADSGVTAADHSGPRLRAGAAERILVWPFDEVTFARVVAIPSSVTAGIIARMLLRTGRALAGEWSPFTELRRSPVLGTGST